MSVINKTLQMITKMHVYMHVIFLSAQKLFFLNIMLVCINKSVATNG